MSRQPPPSRIQRWLSAVALIQIAILVASRLFFAVIPNRQLNRAPIAPAPSPFSAPDDVVAPMTFVAKRGRVDTLELVGTPEALSAARRAATGGIGSMRRRARSASSRSRRRTRLRPLRRCRHGRGAGAPKRRVARLRLSFLGTPPVRRTARHAEPSAPRRERGRAPHRRERRRALAGPRRPMVAAAALSAEATRSTRG